MSTTATPGQVEVVFPGSPLTQINKTKEGLNKFICRIDIDLPQGKKAHGTGTLINRYYVLTAAHNVANSTFGDALRVTVVPAQNGDYQPYGSYTTTKWHFPRQYRDRMPPYPSSDGTTDYSRYLYDYALIELEQPAQLDAALFPQPYATTVHQLKASPSIIKGYPGNQAAGTMWEATGNLTINDEATEFLFYKISTYGADSGAAVLTSMNGEFFIAGVHVAGSGPGGTLDSNWGVRVFAEMTANIGQWMNKA